MKLDPDLRQGDEEEMRGSSPRMTCYENRHDRIMIRQSSFTRQMRGSISLLPLWEKVARCVPAASRMRGGLPLSRSHLPSIVIPANASDPASCAHDVMAGLDPAISRQRQIRGSSPRMTQP
jgi:hypothetical protein